MDKVYYLEHLFLMTLFAFKYFNENLRTESLVVLKYMLRLSTAVPDHKVSIALFHQQGLLHRFMGNPLGAIRSFEKIRDAAEDIGDCFKEVTAYY